MKLVEIERLLQWTFCDQITKRAEPRLGMRNAWDIVERHSRLGCRVQASQAVPAYRSDILSLPDANALIVAREVEKLSANIVVDWSTSKEALLGHLTGLAPGEQLLSFNEIEIVIEHAQSKAPPIWNVGLPKLGPVVLANGKAAVSGSRYGKDRYSEGSHCPLQWAQPTIESIAIVRARYAVWHSALTRLASSLGGKLKNVTVMPLTSSPAPWNTATHRAADAALIGFA